MLSHLHFLITTFISDVVTIFTFINATTIITITFGVLPLRLPLLVFLCVFYSNGTGLAEVMGQVKQAIALLQYWDVVFAKVDQTHAAGRSGNPTVITLNVIS